MKRTLIAAAAAALVAAAAAALPAYADPPPTHCLPKLTTCGYPTAATTGPRTGHTLTPTTPGGGVLTTSSNNQVIEDLDITGCIIVNHTGVVIRDVKVHGDCFYYILVNPGKSATVQYTEVKCNGANTGISEDDDTADLTVSNSWISGCENGLNLGADATVTDNVMAGFEAIEEAHGDLIQTYSPSSNITIDHNSLLGYNDMTSSIITPASAGTMTITDNFMMAGAYTLYCHDNDNWTVTGNRFYDLGEDAATRETDKRSPAFGEVTDCEAVDTNGGSWSGNFIDGTGATLNDDSTVS
jgi:hypothetical protein